MKLIGVEMTYREEHEMFVIGLDVEKNCNTATNIKPKYRSGLGSLTGKFPPPQKPRRCIFSGPETLLLQLLQPRNSAPEIKYPAELLQNDSADLLQNDPAELYP